MISLIKTWELSKLYYFVLKLKKVKRSTKHVEKEYGSSWEKWTEKINKARSLSDFFQSQPTKKRVFIANKKVVYGVCDDSFYIKAIESNIKKYFKKAKKIIEYGSGPGRNLLYLKNRNPKWILTGLELTSTGAQVTRLASKKFRIPVKVVQYDLKKDRFPGISDVGYSSFALEQIPARVDEAKHILLKVLLRVKYGLVILEPFGEYYPITLRGIFARLFHKKMGYCSSFGLALEELQKEGFIVLKKHAFKDSHNPLLYPTLAVALKKDLKKVSPKAFSEHLQREKD
ncbi:MAG: hypothetical protein KGQ54_02965 [Verrucomicrobia bacterium]|nr:hypothetical protein [Verrucomicrobiota bacterium]